MYAKCGALATARNLLEEICADDIIPWTALIGGYAQQGKGQDALDCFEHMRAVGFSPDAVTFICILKACGSIGLADKGEDIHENIVRHGLVGESIVLDNALIDMYVKCGALAKALHVLEELSGRNVVSWNTVIAGYNQHGLSQDALDCFERMRKEGLTPDAVTFTCMLKACGAIEAADKGACIHREIARQGMLENNVMLGTALVDMYAKCGALAMAQSMLEELPLQDVVSWNALIAGYAQQNQGEEALDCFEQMRCKGFVPNTATLSCVFKACASLGALERGEQIHKEIATLGLLKNNVVLNNALVDMYAKCGAFSKARQLLEEHPCPNVVSWNALISGYVQQGQAEDALICFKLMAGKHIEADEVTIICMLKACGSIGALDKGEELHDMVLRQKLLGRNFVLDTALVDMYAKCSALAKAWRVLHELPVGNVVAWNALIAGFIQRGEGDEALNCFECMQGCGLSPDMVTFTCLLKACAIVGMLEKGRHIHNEIARGGLWKNEIMLGNALIHMYASCGAAKQAQQVLDELQVQDVAAWSALISGYGQLGWGEEALNCIKEMESKGVSPNALTLSSVLNACSHTGLVNEGITFFANICTKLDNKPVLEHYTCIVDLFTRVGDLYKAIFVIQRMPFADYSAVWLALLAACGRRGDAIVGRWAFEHVVQVYRMYASVYISMANTHAAADNKQEENSLSIV